MSSSCKAAQTQQGDGWIQIFDFFRHHFTSLHLPLLNISGP